MDNRSILLPAATPHMAAKVMECATCGQSFPSRNQLFKHLKKLGHGVQTGDGNDDTTTSAKNSNEKAPQKERGNQAYYRYYSEQKIINIEQTDDENEQLWNEVYDTLRSPLPITYRIQESSWVGSDFSAKLLSLVAKDDLHQWEIDGSEGEPKIRMTTTNEYHHFNKSRNENSNRDRKLSSLLHSLQELGAAYRQELVSAIPPIALWSCASDGDEHKTEIIADLCSAPGSKALQLLDLLHMNDNGEGRKNIPNGILVVNDSDRNRIITLCQRSRRVPRSPMLAINMDARYFPGMRRKSGYKQKYNKVLVDAPCSGDGTCRKSKNVWIDWSISQAMSLHKLQRKILRRGLELLKPNGFLVYSTCSLNPLENEAVVSSVLADIGGTDNVKIIPLPACISSKFKVMRGLSTWLVPNSKYGKADKGDTEVFDMFKCFDDVPVKLQTGKMTPSMFPTTSDLELMRQLQYCGRFVPMKDSIDSGGFFVACLQRLQVGELGNKGKAKKKEQDDNAKATTSGPIKRAKLSENYAQTRTVIEEDTNETALRGKELREGDWICEACGKLNFGRRDSQTCFGCKKRKPRLIKADKKVKRQPLLKQPCKESELGPFLDFFGIPSSNSAFQNVRVIHRKRENTFVLVSDPVDSLSISEQWGAFREAGISLITKSNVQAEDNSEGMTLFDEAVPILALHATKRVIDIDPILFQRALAQSIIKDLQEESAETERIKTTIDIPLSPLCGNNGPWYESIEIELEPGSFIVTCKCSLKGVVGRFSFWCVLHEDGSITTKTSSRVLAATLVVVHTYLELQSKEGVRG